MRASYRRGIWSERFPRCVNCGSSGYARRGRGFCERCFPWAERLRLIETWDVRDSRTWKDCPYRGILSPDVNEHYIDACRELCERELYVLKLNEERCRGEQPVEGLDIEYEFSALCRLLKIRNRDHFHGWATTFSHTLDPAARRLVYRCLSDLLTLNPRKRSVWVRALHLSHRRYLDASHRRSQR